MQFETDDIFHIGAQHLRNGMPCQDYALSGEFDGGAYAIVSDGCSTGGRTDVGSRIVGLAMAQSIRETLRYPNDCPFGSESFMLSSGMERRSIMRAAQLSLGLTQRDMLATCLFVAAAPRGLVASIIGDGVFATQDIAGTLCMTKFEWDRNIPLYPAYEQDDYAGFIRAHGGDLAIISFRAETVIVDNCGNVTSPLSSEYSIGVSLRGVTYRYDAVSLKSLRYAAMFSDGVTQVDGMNWVDAVRELMAFKSGLGEFVKRRMNRFLKDIGKIGRGPLDDIAYAVIEINHEPESVAP